MQWLDENAVALVLACAIAAAVLAGGWLQTGRRALALGALVPILLAVALLVTRQLVVTDRERVEMTLREIAEHVKRNDVPTVLRFADPESPAVADAARRELPRYDFHDVRIKRNLEIEIDDRFPPRRAVARFNVTVELSDKTGLLRNQPVPRYAIVTFIERDGRWLVSDYEHHPPQESLRTRP